MDAVFALSTRIDVWLLPQPVEMMLQCPSHEPAILIGHVLLRPRADAQKQLPERLGAPSREGFRLFAPQASDELKGHARMRRDLKGDIGDDAMAGALAAQVREQSLTGDLPRSICERSSDGTGNLIGEIQRLWLQVFVGVNHRVRQDAVGADTLSTPLSGAVAEATLDRSTLDLTSVARVSGVFDRRST